MKIVPAKTNMHKWKRDRHGNIDDFVWDYEFHNGVECEICGITKCVHCEPNYLNTTDCEDHYICPNCGEHLVDDIWRFCPGCGAEIDRENIG